MPEEYLFLWMVPGEAESKGYQGGERYQEFFARCDRLKNSPLFYMWRRLNGKEGQHCGRRNALRRAGRASRDERVYVPAKRGRLMT